MQYYYSDKNLSERISKSEFCPYSGQELICLKCYVLLLPETCANTDYRRFLLISFQSARYAEGRLEA
jgi:hypothetical protein